jgi:hypothetical protein
MIKESSFNLNIRILHVKTQDFFPYPMGHNIGQPHSSSKLCFFFQSKKNIPNLEVGNLKEKVPHFQFWCREIALQTVKHTELKLYPQINWIYSCFENKNRICNWYQFYIKNCTHFSLSLYFLYDRKGWTV